MALRPKIPPRIVLYPKDVENITGRKGRTARKILQTIREVFGKPPFAFVTVQEFSAVYQISEEIIYEFLKD
jgi:predicted RNA-binding protein YlqC (UPF0109 family)